MKPDHQLVCRQPFMGWDIFQTSANGKALVLSVAVAGFFAILYEAFVGHPVFSSSVPATTGAHLSGIVAFAVAVEAGVLHAGESDERRLGLPGEHTDSEVGHDPAPDAPAAENGD